jgi:predicted Zn-dependent protease
MKSRKFLFLLTLLCTVLFWDSVQSFSINGYQWPKGVFKYYINPQNRDIAEADVVPAIKKGARAWNTWVRARYLGVTTLKRARNDGQNTIFFRKPEYGALATTYVFSKGSEILDVDIVFWDNPWKFYAGTTGCTDGFYITDVATHEFGHAIGLGHSRDKQASMYKSCGWCSNEVRTLATDDRNAASRLYGLPQTTGMILNPGN